MKEVFYSLRSTRNSYGKDVFTHVEGNVSAKEKHNNNNNIGYRTFIKIPARR